jgi:putative ABC transport system substrate-binding protein
VRRRDFISTLGGLVALPFAAHAQQPPNPVVGFFPVESPDMSGHKILLRAFHQGLSEAGYVGGVAIEYRWADGQYDWLPAMVADLVSRQVAVIYTASDPATLAAKAATTSVPIVFTIGGDPVEMGLVASLNRPGGNVTGVTAMNAELLPKKLELLHELVPAATATAALVNPANPTAETLARDMHAAAHTLGLELHVLHASREADFTDVFATLVQLRAGGLLIGADPFFISRKEVLAALALRHGVLTISHYREFGVAGGLMAYGGSITGSYHQGGVYIGRILKGEKPADIPVQRVTKVELTMNLKTAKALGIEVPELLLSRADEVIQ